MTASAQSFPGCTSRGAIQQRAIETINLGLVEAGSARTVSGVNRPVGGETHDGNVATGRAVGHVTADKDLAIRLRRDAVAVVDLKSLDRHRDRAERRAPCARPGARSTEAATARSMMRSNCWRRFRQPW